MSEMNAESMSEPNKQDVAKQAVPFFARYLEGQASEELSDEELKTIAGGQRKYKITNRYPSDDDTLILDNLFPPPGYQLKPGHFS